MDKSFLDDLTKKLNESFAHIKEVKHDVEKNIQAVLQSAFVKMDLVTRTEFDAQVAVLAKTRKKLEALEKKLEEMEGKKESKKK